MSDKVFLDTNVLIYFYSENEIHKRDVACRALNSNDCITSTQVLSEASNVWFNKCKWNGMKIKEHLDNIELVCDEILTVQRNTINQALELRERYGYSYYDCLMLASALDGNCRAILTEDMQDGQIINNTLKIVNPFKEA